jgi:hypothetical protein
MTAIWKQVFNIEDEFTLALPIGSQILTVQSQDNNVYIWYLVPNTNAELYAQKFFIFGTGNPISMPIESTLKYIGTWQDKPFVWHLFMEVFEISRTYM